MKILLVEDDPRTTSYLKKGLGTRVCRGHGHQW